MAKVVLYLRSEEASALQQLAQRDYRQLKAQAALIIRKALEWLGLISPIVVTFQIPQEVRDESISAA